METKVEDCPAAGTGDDSLVLCGDCRELVPGLGKFDLAFLDPPFNIGQKYTCYKDMVSRNEFVGLIEQSVMACWDACNGVMALHGPDDLADLYLDIARRNDMRRIAWTNWHYRFGQCIDSNWIDSRCHCIIYAKCDDHTWNADDILVDSDRKTKYGDKRIQQSSRAGKRVPMTLWGIPSDGRCWGRIQGNNAERRGNHPNQLPEVYLARLIKAYTNPGDRILDPFCGSGTTATVAKALGRKCVTIDISPQSVASAKERILRGAVRV